ncbi:MAG: type IV toxin-antitoxin system AbiEi family antitoxin domain-containing protein [Acidimicrobiia bacterium]
MTLDRDVEALAVSQDGLITDAQAQGFGAKPEAIRHRRKTGRWIRHRRGVYRIVGAVVTQRLELLAAILATPGSVGSQVAAELRRKLAANAA